MIEKEKDNLELEREQLNILIKRGVKFQVVNKVRKRKRGLRGFFQKAKEEEVITSYEIHEPTLAVLDRICEVSLDMAIDEEAIKDEMVIAEAKKITKQNTLNMARLIAIAVLGEDYYITEITPTGNTKRYNNEKELTRLTNIFFHNIKPSKLALLTSTITNISNLADFITSMRLTSGARTTKPIKGRIE